MGMANVRRALMVAVVLGCGLGMLPAPSLAATVMITGANSGIGLEFTKQYAAKGWTVIATHRRSSVPETLADLVAKFDNVRVEHLDVTDVDEARSLARKLADVPIDVLINNAGVYNDRRDCHEEDCPGDWSTQTFGNLRFPLLDTIMAVNIKGPLSVAEAFFPNVEASEQKKIVNISSTNGSLTDPYGGPESAGAIFYRASKAALNKSMQLVANQAKKSGVTVVLIHPGAVATERQSTLEGLPGIIETQLSVEQMVGTIDGLTIEDAGRFVNYDGKPLAW